MRNWTCIVFGPNQKNKTEPGVTYIQEFLENESLTTDFSDTRRVGNLLWKMVFLKFWTQYV